MRKTCSRPFWLIAKYRTGGMEVLRIILASGEEALPVFSFEDEARMFLELGTSGCWRVRETRAGELTSVLFSLCAGVDRVVLDPLPGPDAILNDLLSMGRRAFVEFAVKQGRNRQIAGHQEWKSPEVEPVRAGWPPADATARTATLERR